MAQSSQQPVTEALQSSSPIQRLDRRRTESPGVINVRSFQAHLARVPGWMMQRSALVDQLQRRYNSQENSSASGEDLVWAAPSQPVPKAQPLPTPTPVQTAAPSSSASDSGRTASGTIAKSVAAIGASDSSLSGKFRVSRKAIPLPNGEGGASSSKKSSEIPSINSLTKGDRTETVSFPQPSTQSLQNEIGSTSQLSQQPESSLILPKRVNHDVAPTPTDASATSSFSSNSGANIPTKPPTESSTSYSIIPASPVKFEINTQTQTHAKANPQSLSQPLSLPKHISQDISRTVSPPLILPKRINPEVYQPSTSSGETFSSSPKLPAEAEPDVKAEIAGQTIERSHPPTIQPKVAPEITSTPNTSQQVEPSLILPKRINQENLSDSVGSSVSLNHSSETQVERSSLSKNSVDAENANSYNLAPLYQSKIAQVIYKTVNQSQPLEPKLILPKRMNSEVYQRSTSSEGNFSSSSNLSTKVGTDVKSEIGKTVERSHPIPAQPTIASEITSTPNTSQQAELSLILPKRINQDNSSDSVSSSVNLNPSSKTQVGRSSLSKNVAGTASTNSYISTPLNQSKISQVISQPLNQSQLLEPKLILPKRIASEVYQPSSSSENNFISSPRLLPRAGTDVKFEIEKSVERSHPISTQPTIASEITSTPNTSQQAELSLILPKRINQDNSSNFANDSIFAKQETENENVGTKQDRLNTSSVAIAKEIAVAANPLKQQSMIWRKTASTPSAENGFSSATNKNTQTAMPFVTSSRLVQGQINRKMSISSNSDYLYAAEMESEMPTNAASFPQETSRANCNVNVAEVAEQVSRILQRELTIERERRGMNLWY